jgi:hypothetical protein
MFLVAGFSKKSNPSFDWYQKTKKLKLVPEAPAKKFTSLVSEGKTWISQKQSAPTNSPQLNASPGKLSFIFLSTFIFWSFS